MKRSIINILPAILLTLGLGATVSSCKKTLDAKPYSSFTTANFFNDETEARMAVLGVYQAMASLHGYGYHIPFLFDFDTDIAFWDQGGITSDRAIPHYNGIAETVHFYNTWSALYSGIDRANVVIESIPKMAQYKSDTLKARLDRLVGEALFLRGFYYSELIRFWGDVPFKTTPSVTGDNFKLPRTDRHVIYDSILKDMEAAAELLPAALPADERVNKWAVKGMIARIALHAGGWSLHGSGGSGTMQRVPDYQKYYRIAERHLDAVIGSGLYKLSSNFTQLFKNQCQFVHEPTENMFEVAFASPNGTGGNWLGNLFSVSTTAGVYNGSLGRIRATRTFYNDFDTLDIRRDFSIATYSINAQGQKVQLWSARGDENWTMAKWSREYQKVLPTENSTTSINTVILRYADVLLMKAEVENELNGPTAAAYSAINEVRRRGFGLTTTGAGVKFTLTNAGTGYTGVPVITVSGGGGTGATPGATVGSGRINALYNLSMGSGYTAAPTVTVSGGGGSGAVITATLLPRPNNARVDLPAGLSKEQFFQAVMKERAFELVFEGTRRTDLIRWNMLAAKIAETDQRLNAYRTNYIYLAADYFIKDKHELYPIPLNEIEVNRSIVQNPGY